MLSTAYFLCRKAMTAADFRSLFGRPGSAPSSQIAAPGAQGAQPEAAALPGDPPGADGAPQHAPAAMQAEQAQAQVCGSRVIFRKFIEELGQWWQCELLLPEGADPFGVADAFRRHHMPPGEPK